MRVALVCPYDIGAPGGVQAQVVGLADEINGRGEEAWIVAPGRHPSAPVRTIGGSTTIRSNDSVAPVSLDPRSWSKTKAEVSDADVVHIHEPFMPLTSWSALASEIPKILTFHADPPRWARRLYRGGGGGLRKLIRSASAVTAVSPVAAGAVTPLVEHVEIVPNGVGLPPTLDETRDPLSVVFIGRDETRKGLDVLLHAWPRIRADAPGAHLTVIGNAMPVALEGVEFAGVCADEEKFAVLGRSSLFVAPNRRGESFGITVAEAMAYGCAVIASDLPAFRHVAGESAEFITPGDSEALAKTVVALFRDPDRVAAMTRKGVERARDFSWERVGNKYLEMYHNAAFI